MSFQISKIVIYGQNGDVRTLPLRTGKVNVVTGASKTGKSALIHIVSYCLGSSKSTIPEGVILESVVWFGVQIEHNEESLFIARRNPGPGKASSEDIYLEKGHDLNTPAFASLVKNANLESISTLLTDFAGITAYAVEPKTGQTRRPGIADISKALIYCFQEQSEVANQRILFHRQNEPFLPQSIKDYLPFFLGVVGRQYIAQKDELKKLKNELKRLEALEVENERLKGNAFEKPYALIQEAISVGLLPSDQIFPKLWEEIKDILKVAISVRPENDPVDGNSNQILDQLFEEQKVLREKHRLLGDEIIVLKAFKNGGKGFTYEATEHRARLLSIGLIDTNNNVIHSCPFCSSRLSSPIPNADAIRKNLENITKQIESVTADMPHIERLIALTEEQQTDVSSKLRVVRSKIESIQQSDRLIEGIRDANAKRSLIQGRIGFYLESIAEMTDEQVNNTDIERLKVKIEKLEELTNDDEIQSVLQSVLSHLSQEMTEMSRELGLEHSKFPIRLDIKKLTIVADTENGPLPLERMGSCETWVSLHLIIYLVLQRWFAKKNLPVPRFVFFDQPTQAYFPPDSTDDVVRNTDRESVIKMFKMIKQKAEEAGIQVVIMEHADIQQDWFQEMVIEKWWDGKTKLVPFEWIVRKNDV